MERAYLIPESDLGLEQRCILLEGESVDIGRQTEEGIAIPVESVSRRHARISRGARGWEIADLGSSNGTFVNGEQVTEKALEDGDLLTLGKANLTFHVSAEDEQSPCDKDNNSDSSWLRLVAEDEDSSVILSTFISDRTPFKMPHRELTAEDHLDTVNRKLLALYQLSDVLRDATSRQAILAALIDLVFQNLPADRAVILNYDEETDEVVPELFRFREGTEEREFVLSKSITRRAISERVAVLSRDLRVDSRFQSSESLLSSDIRSAICVPLAGKRNLLGLLFLDSKEAIHAFNEDDLAFAGALAADAAMTLENLQLVEDNLRQERLAAVGQTISGLAHNIKNILQLARGGLELMDGAISRSSIEDISTLWPITKRSIDRMQALTQEMLDFSRQTKPMLAPLDVNELVTQLVELLRQDKRSHTVTVTLECDPECGQPTADGDGLNKALMNLLSNSFDALQNRPDASIVIRTRRHRSGITVHVADNGPGIPAEILGRIFTPFFSTKGSKGNGLGLSMTRKYMEDMGGKLDVKSEPGSGCEFILTLSHGADGDS